MLNCIFIGDVMPGAQESIESPDTDIMKDFANSDIVLGNLESPLVFQPPSIVNLNKLPLWSTTKHIDIIKTFNFTHLGLNNNHAFDLFEKGIDQTIKTLTKSNIKAFGLNFNGISQFEIIEQNGIRLGIFAVNWIQPHFSTHLVEPLTDIDIAKLKKHLDFLIFFLHWGNDHNIFINMEQQDTARQLIDQGADLVIGHHPHNLQGHELYKGKHIFYSLGNFIFTPKEFYDSLPYLVRFENDWEDVLFQRTVCKIGEYVSILFNKKDYNVLQVTPIYRQHTLPVPLPERLFPVYEDLKTRMNTQVATSEYELNEAERKRILFSYTLPLILKHPKYWPILFTKLSSKKLIRLIRPHKRK